MPKARDYSTGKIYKIDVDGKLYVGHTIQVFSQRWNEHKKTYKKDPARIPKLYKAIQERGGFDGLRMELIETYPCNNIDELKSREAYWIRELQSELNTYIPMRTDKERYYEDYETERQKRKDNYQEHKEEINAKRREKMKTPEAKAKKAEADKQYREANKEKLREEKRKYYEANAEKLKQKKKEYREQNKEKIKQKKKEYYEANKEAINQKKRESKISKVIL